MGKRFHINKHGVPATCNSQTGNCHYGDERHFDTYEKAKDYADKLQEEIKTGIPIDKDNPAKKIRSYYTSASSVNEFPLNRRMAYLENFELVVVSWMAKDSIEKQMKLNRIGKAKFTYGDIVRILNEEIKERFETEIELEKYYNPHPQEIWTREMNTQRKLYKDHTDELAKKFGFESMEIITLPLSARTRLHSDGFLLDPGDIHEVIYKVSPAVSRLGDVISYSHNTKETSKEFDIYELAGAVEGKGLHELFYSKSVEEKFKSLWNNIQLISMDDIDYNTTLELYRQDQFFKGIEGADALRPFVKMSPIVAQEVATFIENYKAIIFAVEGILDEQGISSVKYDSNLEEEDDGDWIID